MINAEIFIKVDNLLDDNNPRTFVGEKVELNGQIEKMEQTVTNFGHRKITKLTIVQDTGLGGHIMARCRPTPYQNEFENELRKRDDKMAVKIKKQPKEITLEELKQGKEYEEVKIHIDVEKQDEIEKKYGITYRYDDVLSSDMFGESNSEINFKEHYLIYGREKVPYDFITKIEVVEK